MPRHNARLPGCHLSASRGSAGAAQPSAPRQARAWLNGTDVAARLTIELWGLHVPEALVAPAIWRGARERADQSQRITCSITNTSTPVTETYIQIAHVHLAQPTWSLKRSVSAKNIVHKIIGNASADSVMWLISSAR